MTTQKTVPRELIEQAIAECEAACGGRCNAEYNPCSAQETARELRAALIEQPAQGEAPTPEFSHEGDGCLSVDFSPAKGQMLTISISPTTTFWALTWDGAKANGSESIPALQSNAVDELKDYAERWRFWRSLYGDVDYDETIMQEIESATTPEEIDEAVDVAISLTKEQP